MIAYLVQFVLGLVFWLVLAEGQLGSLAVGVPVIIAAIAAGRLVGPVPLRQVRPLRAITFIFHFAWGCTLAGIDVTRRIVGRRVDVMPAWFTYDLRLPEGLARHLFVHAINLQPGTVCFFDEDGHLRLWVLDSRIDNQAAVRGLEDGIAAVFGYDLAKAGEAA